MNLTVKLKPAELATKIIENRDKFVKNYELALEGYYKDLNDYANAIKKCAKDKVFPIKILRPMPPNNHIEDYNNVISMIQSDQSELIEIGSHDYRNYVLDQWDWKDHWLVSNSKYLDK